MLGSCKEPAIIQNKEINDRIIEHTTTLQDPTVYETDHLIIRKLSDHVYSHISFLNTDDFGRVGCNGMLVINENEAVVFDTPTDDDGSSELIDYLSKKLQVQIKAIIATHFHEDCIGGLALFNENKIPVYASNKTTTILKNKAYKYVDVINSFDNMLTLKIGDKEVYAEYFGEGHTRDNIIGYFPEDKAIFGGCLIKTIAAKKGNLADANTKEWSKTVGKIKQKYSQTKIVIPGHGKWGGIELLDYTMELFE